MFPLLTDFDSENDAVLSEDPFDILEYIIKNFPKSTVQNGEKKGSTLSRAIRFYGSEVLGKSGIETGAFKNGGKDIIPYIDKTGFSESEAMIYPFGIVENMVDRDGFYADHLSLNGKVGLYEKESFVLAFCITGEHTVSHYGGTFRLKPGNLLFIPADFRVELTGAGNLIIIYCR